MNVEVTAPRPTTITLEFALSGLNVGFSHVIDKYGLIVLFSFASNMMAGNLCGKSTYTF